MSIILADLPLEILEMIADRVCCSQGYSSFRLTCKKMYWSTRSVKRYHTDGELFEKIPIRVGKPHGIARMYYTDGTIAGTREYKEGKLCNIEKLFFKSGKLLHKGNFDNGRVSGIHFWYNFNGTIKKSHDYTIPGEEQYIEYNKEGDRLMTCRYEMGRLHGPVDFYVDDNSHISFRYINGKMSGVFSITSIFHTMSFIGNIIEDVPHGDQTLYNEDGDIKSIVPFFYGRKNGLFRRYYDSGNLMMAVKYRNNLRQGVEKVWWDDGKLKLTRNWVNGKKNGLCKVYNRDGIITNKCNFKDDNLEGLNIKYSQLGNYESITCYKNGKMLNNIIYYHNNTNNISQTNFLENNKTETNFTSFYDKPNIKNNIKLIKYERGVFKFNSNTIVVKETQNKLKNTVIKLGTCNYTRFEKNYNTISQTLSLFGKVLYI